MSGEILGTYGLYDATSFGLSKSGYTVVGWLNVDGTGKTYNTYDFSSRYSIDDFITKNGLVLKEDNDGAYIYLQPVWKYTNTKPTIISEDVYVLVTSDITIDRLLKDITANDDEDGDLSEHIKINNLEELQENILELGKLNNVEDVVETITMQLEVRDSHGEVTVTEVKVHVIIQGQSGENRGKIRHVSGEYQDYFKDTSVWKTQEYRQALMLLQ